MHITAIPGGHSLDTVVNTSLPWLSTAMAVQVLAISEIRCVFMKMVIPNSVFQAHHQIAQHLDAHRIEARGRLVENSTAG